MYSMLQGDDAKLKGVPRIARASVLTSEVLLSLCFPAGSDGIAPDERNLVDLGSGFGGTARMAAKAYGCHVRLRPC